jgi:AraC-like DNA-binding protein
MLVDTNLRIWEVAEACSLSNEYFSRLFKRVTGQTPLSLSLPDYDHDQDYDYEDRAFGLRMKSALGCSMATSEARLPP